MSPADAVPFGFAAALALAACGPDLPEPAPRVVAVAPRGAVRGDAVRAEFEASEPLAPEGIVDGRRVALCREADLATVKRLAAAEAGLGEGAPVLAARATLEDGGRRAVLVPAAPLPRGRYAALLAPGVLAADGRPLLDPEGKQRAIVVEFEATAPPGEPPRAAITEVLADAETPEAGGEFVEVVNLGARPLDLAGLRLAKHGPTGAVTRCVLSLRAGGALPAGGVAVVAGGAWDGRWALPPGTPLYQCGAGAVLGGLANDRAPAIQLEDPDGAILSTLGVAALAPRCAEGSLRRVDADGPDAASNLACPGAVSPGAFP